MSMLKLISSRQRPWSLVELEIEALERGQAVARRSV